MDIHELESSKIHSTNNYTKKGYLLYPDKTISEHYYTCLPYYTSKIYPNSQLGNLSSLTIKFYDSFGTPLDFGYIQDTGDEEDIIHPKNRLLQNHISLVIGVVSQQFALRLG